MVKDGLAVLLGAAKMCQDVSGARLVCMWGVCSLENTHYYGNRPQPHHALSNRAVTLGRACGSECLQAKSISGLGFRV